MIDYLSNHPLAGDEIPGTDGVRKLRFAGSGRGRRVGARVVYFYGGEDLPVYALLAYAKSESPAMVHASITVRKLRKRVKLTQAQMASLIGMSLSGYRK